MTLRLLVGRLLVGRLLVGRLLVLLVTGWPVTGWPVTGLAGFWSCWFLVLLVSFDRATVDELRATNQ
jgi:hypothetical protein